jgi:hypothetical protein
MVGLEGILRIGWRTSIRCAAFLVLTLLTVSLGFAGEPNNISGTWRGSVEGVQFPLFVLHVISKDGRLSVSCDLPERGFGNLPGANSSLSNEVFRFDLPCWNDSHYAGKLDRTGKIITGRIERDDGLSRVLVLKHTSEDVPPTPSSGIEGDWFGLLRSPRYPSLRLVCTSDAAPQVN